METIIAQLIIIIVTSLTNVTAKHTLVTNYVVISY
jgi:hypothetical protein